MHLNSMLKTDLATKIIQRRQQTGKKSQQQQRLTCTTFVDNIIEFQVGLFNVCLIHVWDAHSRWLITNIAKYSWTSCVVSFEHNTHSVSGRLLLVYSLAWFFCSPGHMRMFWICAYTHCIYYTRYSLSLVCLSLFFIGFALCHSHTIHKSLWKWTSRFSISSSARRHSVCHVWCRLPLSLSSSFRSAPIQFALKANRWNCSKHAINFYKLLPSIFV